VADRYGEEGSQAFLAELDEQDRKAVIHLQHDPGESRPDQWLDRFQSAGAELILLYTYVKPASDLLRTAYENDYHPLWLGSYVISGPDLVQFAGSRAAQGLRATSYPAGPRAHRGERLFRKIMARRYPDQTPGTHSRIGYAAAQLVVEGLKRSGPELTREAFTAALESLEDWTGGLLPPISFSADDHRGLTALSLQRIISGRWVLEKNLLQLKE
jgi:ABC-type branched-subunit amino acid transport system substrate-binding protein